jgi:hypothetical protein
MNQSIASTSLLWNPSALIRYFRENPPKRTDIGAGSVGGETDLTQIYHPQSCQYHQFDNHAFEANLTSHSKILLLCLCK